MFETQRFVRRKMAYTNNRENRNAVQIRFNYRQLGSFCRYGTELAQKSYMSHAIQTGIVGNSFLHGGNSRIPPS